MLRRRKAKMKHARKMTARPKNDRLDDCGPMALINYDQLFGLALPPRGDRAAVLDVTPRRELFRRARAGQYILRVEMLETCPVCARLARANQFKLPGITQLFG